MTVSCCIVQYEILRYLEWVKYREHELTRSFVSIEILRQIHNQMVDIIYLVNS